MFKPGNPTKTTTLSPEREVARRLLNDDERSIIAMMERDLRRLLTDQEEFLALEQARALGMV